MSRIGKYESPNNPTPRSAALLRSCYLLVLLSLLTELGCTKTVRLASVPDNYRVPPLAYSVQDGGADFPSTRGKAYALELVKASVARVDPSVATDFHTDAKGISFTQKFFRQNYYSPDPPKSQKLVIAWSEIVACYMWSTTASAYLDYCPRGAACSSNNAAVIEIPMGNPRIRHNFVAGIRALSGLDPDPDPTPLVQPAALPVMDPRPASHWGCQKDTDCKGTRVCEDGRCVDR